MQIASSLSHKTKRSFQKYKQILIDNQQNKIFRLVNLGCKMAIRPQLRKKKKNQDPLRIIGTMQNQQGMRQLWLAKKIKNQKVQLVNWRTDLVIQNDGGDLKLMRGASKNNQIFQIQNANKGINIIRIKQYNNNYLALDGILDISRRDKQDSSLLFQIKQIDLSNYDQAQNTFVIIHTSNKQQSNKSNYKAFDIEQASDQIGTQVSLYQFHNRCNQRWIFQPTINQFKDQQQQVTQTKYLITSFLNGCSLNISKKGKLCIGQNQQKVWVIKNKIGFSGQLYHLPTKKFVLANQNGSLTLKSSSSGTRFDFI